MCLWYAFKFGGVPSLTDIGNLLQASGFMKSFMPIVTEPDLGSEGRHTCPQLTHPNQTESSLTHCFADNQNVYAQILINNCHLLPYYYCCCFLYIFLLSLLTCYLSVICFAAYFCK